MLTNKKINKQKLTENNSGQMSTINRFTYNVTDQGPESVRMRGGRSRLEGPAANRRSRRCQMGLDGEEESPGSKGRLNLNPG